MAARDRHDKGRAEPVAHWKEVFPGEGPLLPPAYDLKHTAFQIENAPGSERAGDAAAFLAATDPRKHAERKNGTMFIRSSTAEQPY